MTVVQGSSKKSGNNMEYKKLGDCEYITLSKEDLQMFLACFDEPPDIHKFLVPPENTKLWIGIVHKATPTPSATA